MKKKMSLLCALIMAVMVSVYSVSGTYAKYISSVDVKDTARVAKWGVNVTDTKIDLFQASYDTVVDEKGVYNYVLSEDGKTKVVAPGTKGQYTFKIDFGTGAPETNYRLNVNVLDDSYDKINNYDNNGYNPVRYYLYDVKADKYADYKNTADAYDLTFDELKEALEKLYSGVDDTENNKKSFVYAANTTPADYNEALEYTIGWEWSFDDSYTDNELDTELGNLIAEGEDLSVLLHISVVAQQVVENSTN